MKTLNTDAILATLRRSPTAYIKVWRPWGERNFRYALVRGTSRQSEEVLDYALVRRIKGKLIEGPHISGPFAAEQYTLRGRE